MTRYATSRQKSCHQCSIAKSKCDRSSPCSRCEERSLPCTYVQTAAAAAAAADLEKPVSSSATDAHTRPGEAFVSEAYRADDRADDRANGFTDTQAREAPDFANLELVCSIKAEEISSRWLNPYVSAPGQTVKNYPPGVTRFVVRVLNSYAGIAVRGHGLPPFVHPMQTSAASPLTVCLSLIRICERPLPGSESVSMNVLKQEMDNLRLEQTLDQATELARFQAYLIYALVIFFRLSRASDPFFRQAMISLQELACASAAQGTVCTTEQPGHRARPKWEEWIVAEAKRRTIYTMYLFDSILSAQEGLPTFLGTELRGLPAPGAKALWQATSRSAWEQVYNLMLTEWTEGTLCIDELWPVPADFSKPQVDRRSSRIDQWLESVDEYGMMLYAMTSATHGS